MVYDVGRPLSLTLTGAVPASCGAVQTQSCLPHTVTQHTAWARITLYTTHQQTAQPARSYTGHSIPDAVINIFSKFSDLLHPALLKSTIMMTIMDLPDHSISSASISELSLFSFKSIISTDISEFQQSI